jgi:hypothetical protein
MTGTDQPPPETDPRNRDRDLGIVDHIIIGARSLKAGADYVESLLGVRPGQGGQHLGFGTHNMLLGLGPDCYLEVIAPDPAQPAPPHGRLFELDAPAVHTQLEAAPRLLTWVARVPALDAVLARLGPRGGTALAMARGPYRWRFALPGEAQGADQFVPALIQWETPGPVATLPDSGWRLIGIQAEHPNPDVLHATLAEHGVDDAMVVRLGTEPRLLVRLRHADGRLVVFSNR